MEFNINLDMTDAQLENACSRRKDGYIHTYNWTSEVYSFGKCYREIANYPKLFPLFIYSDHGAGLHSNLYPHEINNRAKIHLTWHPLKYRRYQNFTKRKFIHIPHPWILYRRKKGYKKSDNCRGTIVFFTHHVPGIKWHGHDTEEYFRKLKELPEKFHPIILCMHMHDINAGHHKELRKWGFPIVTAGNIYNDKFVDRFYNLISNFSYGTSQEWGSQTAYMVELGTPYFFLGQPPELVNNEHKEMPLGPVSKYQDAMHEEYVKNAELLFSEVVDTVSHAQKEFVSDILGLNSKVSEKELSKIIRSEFFRNWPYWYVIITGIVINLLSAIGLISLIKKLSLYFLKNNH